MRGKREIEGRTLNKKEPGLSVWVVLLSRLEKMLKKIQVKGESCSTQQLPATPWGPDPACWRFGKNILLEHRHTIHL